MADSDITPTPHGRKRVKITAAQRSEIVARYAAGEGPTKIGADYGIDCKRASSIAARGGAAMRPMTLAARKHSIFDGAFSKITPESAYWAGFIASDGCVQGRQLTVSISLSDRSHIEKLRVFLGSSHKIVVRPACDMPFIKSLGYAPKNNGLASLKISSQQIVDDLAAFGILQRKSYSLSIKRLEMNSHFWRGMVDGDGSIGISDSKPYLNLVGTRDISTQFLAFCKTVAPNIGASVHYRKGAHVLKMASRTAFYIIASLYSDAPVSLNRKADIARRIMFDFSEPYRFRRTPEHLIIRSK